MSRTCLLIAIGDIPWNMPKPFKKYSWHVDVSSWALFMKCSSKETPGFKERSSGRTLKHYNVWKGSTTIRKRIEFWYLSNVLEGKNKFALLHGMRLNTSISMTYYRWVLAPSTTTSNGEGLAPKFVPKRLHTTKIYNHSQM